MRITISKSLAYFRKVGVSAFLVAGAFALAEPGAEAIIGDRIILRIGQTAFSQRQLETYVAIKTVILGGDIDGKEFVGQMNYQSCLENFRQDMLILLEVLRLDRSFPQKIRLEQSLIQVLAAKKKSAVLAELIDRLGLNESSINAEISNILQIIDFKSIKEKSRQKQWFSELEERYDQGFFQNEDSYVVIKPKGR